MKSKKVLILGITHPQIDAILYCKSKKYEVHGLSYRREGVAFPYLDHFSKIDIVDKDAVLNYAKEHKIDLIYSTGSDIALPTVAYVSQKLSLPQDITYDQVMLLINKSNFRDFTLKNGLNPVKFKVGKKLSDFKDWYYFPAIIKPVDSQGQRGVRKVNNHREVEKYFSLALQTSSSKRVIIEEFLKGREINIIMYMYNEKVKYIFLSDRVLIEEATPENYRDGMPVGVVKKHIIPPFIPEEDQEKIVRFATKFVELTGIKYGPVYMQGKYRDGDFNLIEVGPRLDGGHIWKIIKYKYGINLIEICFGRLLGRISSENEFPQISVKDNKRYQIEFFHQKPNEFFKVPVDFSKDKCLEYGFYYKSDEKVKISNGYYEKTGFQITEL